MPRTMPPPPPIEAVVPPPVAPAPRTETVFDSSWKVEIPGSPPAPPPSVFRGWTAETDPLAGPPRRPKPAPQRLQPAPEETQPEPEMIRFRSPWSEATPPAPVQPMPQPMPQPVATMPMAPMPAPVAPVENAPLPAMHFGQPRSDLPATHVPSTAQPIEPPYMAEPAPQPVYAQPTYQPAPMPTPVPVAVARNDNALSPQYAPTVWYLWPLLGLNMFVDLVLNIAGPPGRFFTTRTGRNVMGWVGALLMATAIGIGVCDYLQISWTP